MECVGCTAARHGRVLAYDRGRVHGVGGAEKALARGTVGARSERGREQSAPEHKASEEGNIQRDVQNF